MKTLIARSAVLALGAGTTLAGLVALEMPAHSAQKAKVRVGITQVNTEMSGAVRSTRAKCARNRTVLVWMQVGERGGGDDVQMFQDTTSLEGGRYVWNTGTTGVEGRFYARVGGKKGCKAATSRTIDVFRSE